MRQKNKVNPELKYNYFCLHAIYDIYITISTFTSVRPYGGVCPSVRPVTLLDFQFLPLFHKMSVMIVAWHVFKVKNIHSGSPSDP